MVTMDEQMQRDHRAVLALADTVGEYCRKMPTELRVELCMGIQEVIKKALGEDCLSAEVVAAAVVAGVGMASLAMQQIDDTELRQACGVSDTLDLRQSALTFVLCDEATACAARGAVEVSPPPANDAGTVH